MEQNELEKRYFDWMYRLVIPESQDISYRRLLTYLNSVTFYPLLSMDENRVQDGEDLRYHFGYEHRYLSSEIGALLDHRPCSVLEMMVALAVRMENGMKNPTYGDRTHHWFCEMLTSLGLRDMTDENFDRVKASRIIRNFLERKYAANGKGGLFTVPSETRDMRNAEIWYQMNWYLDSIYYN